MARATLGQIMRRAHEMARGLKGDYQARLSYALKVAWAEHTGKTEEPLVELVGTEKQIAWAEDIRRSQIKILKTYIADWEIRINRDGFSVGYAFILNKHKEALAEICKIKESKFWIENRRIASVLNGQIIRVADYNAENNILM